MTDIDVAALRAAAEGATPGPWELVGDSTWSTLLMSPDNATIHGDDCGCGGGILDQDDIAYIAAANPAVVLELLDRLAAAEGAIARVRDICELDAGRRRVCVYDPDCQCEFKDCYECGKWHNCIHSPLTAVREALDPKEQP